MLNNKERAVCTVPFLGAWKAKSTLSQLITDNITYDGSTYEIHVCWPGDNRIAVCLWQCHHRKVCPILTNSGCETVLGMVNAAAQLASHGATCLAEFTGYRRSRAMCSVVPQLSLWILKGRPRPDPSLGQGSCGMEHCNNSVTAMCGSHVARLAFNPDSSFLHLLLMSKLSQLPVKSASG